MKKALYTFAGFIAATTLFSTIINVTAENKSKETTDDWWDMENATIVYEKEQPEIKEEDLEFSITYYYEDDTYISEEETTEPEVIEPITGGPAFEDRDISYLIQVGDTLWTISEEFYGTGEYYDDIARYNNMDPDETIYAYTLITIPSINNLHNSINSASAVVHHYNSAATEIITEITIEAGDNNGYEYGIRTDPTVDITVPSDYDKRNNTEEVNITEDYEYIGAWNITGYTPDCPHCCGGNTHGIGAAGVYIIPGYSVATKDLPLGVTLYIEGYGYYVNEDRGCGAGVIDIAASSHEECYILTSEEPVDVYIVK